MALTDPTATDAALLAPEDEVDTSAVSLIPVDPEDRAFKREPDHPTDASDEEIKLAMSGSLLGAAGRIGMRPSADSVNTSGAKRLLGPTGVYGDAWLRWQQKMRDRDLLRLGEPPEEAARKSLRPLAPGEIDPRLPDERGWTVGGWMDEADTDAVAARTSLVGESEANETYSRWLTFGDDELDKIMKGSLDTPAVRDGVIAGMRVKGTMPGMEVKVPDEGHIYGLIQSTGDAIRKKLAGKSPQELESISLEQTTALANLIGTNPNKLHKNLREGRFTLGSKAPGHLAANVVAAKNMLVHEIRKLDELTDIATVGRVIDGVAVGPTNADRWAWKEQAELVANIQRDFQGIRTDVGRALSAMRIPAGGEKAMLDRDYSRILDDFGGSDKIAAQIEVYRSLPNDAVKRGYAVRELSGVAKSLDAIHEVWLNSMLSGWFTHIRNTVGVVATIGWDIAETAATAARQVANPLIGRQRDVTFGDLGAKIFGQTMSMREAFTASGRAFWLREDAFQGAGMDVFSGVGGGNPLRGDAWSAANFEKTGALGAFIDWSGHILTLGRAPMRALMTEDAFMKVVSFRGSLYEQAYRAGRAEGLKGDEFAEFIAEFLLEPPRSAREKAVAQSKMVTLQSDMEGALKDLQKFTSNRFMRLLVPFYKTPTNALLYVGERSPFAPAMKRYRDALKEGGEAAANANTRMMMGTGVMLLLWQQWEAGDFTGGLSPDPRLRRAYDRMGIKPYHWRYGDTYYNYSMAEPISTIVGLIGDAMEVINHPDTDDMTGMEVAVATAGVIGFNLTNKSFMTGIQLFMDAARNPGRFGPKMLENYARSMVPGSAALADIQKATDEDKRYHKGLKTFRTALDMLKSRLPGLSHDLEVEYDLWGRSRNVGSRFMSPYKPNAVDKELVRIGLGLEAHPTTMTDPSGNTLGLEPDEVAFYHQRAGKLAKDRMELLITNPAGYDRKFQPGGKPGTGVGAAYKKLRKASLKGNQLATDDIKVILRKLLTAARVEAQLELYLGSEFSADLQSVTDKVNRERDTQRKQWKEDTR
jgi:hypothetical protein